MFFLGDGSDAAVPLFQATDVAAGVNSSFCLNILRGKSWKNMTGKGRMHNYGGGAKITMNSGGKIKASRRPSGRVGMKMLPVCSSKFTGSRR